MNSCLIVYGASDKNKTKLKTMSKILKEIHSNPMESKIYPGFTAFKDKAPDPGRYVIQVDLADENDSWGETWFELVDIDGEGKIVRVRLDLETDGLNAHTPASFNGAVPVAWKPFPYKTEKRGT